MKCRHNVSGFEWISCPKCGKKVRINRFRFAVRWIVIVFIVFWWEVPTKIADWGIDILKLRDLNPYNLTHMLIGGASIIVVYICIDFLLPVVEEKSQIDSNF